MRMRNPCVLARWRLFGWYVRLPLAIAWRFPSEMKAGDAGRRSVYGWSSSQDKGLDKRKSVKTPRAGPEAANPCATVRPASLQATPEPEDRRGAERFPQVFSTVVERFCGFAWR